MQAVIQRVVATETEAKELVRQARIEAEAVLSAARDQARQLIAEAHRAAAAEAETILAGARADAEQTKQARLAAWRDEIKQSLRLEESLRQRCINAAIACLRGQTLNPASGYGTHRHT